MKTLLTTVCLVLTFQLTTVAQKRANHWVFGGNAGLDFSCSPPRLELSSFDGLEGGASISDENGDLLFYTQGDVVWNRHHRKMPNGEAIGGLCSGYADYASSSQSSLIVPHPDDPDLYYIFTTDCAEDEFVNGLRFSVVDMKLDNGMGDVSQKNQLLIAPSAEKVAAVFHANGTDVWVVTHGVNDNRFYAFLITGSGLNPTPIVSSSGQIHSGGRGYLKFSPDGKKLASTSFISGANDGDELEIFSFNDQTGSITTQYVITGLIRSTYSLSFSPDGSKLYTSCSWTCGGKVEQFDLSAGGVADIIASRYTFQPASPIYPYGGFQLGPDGMLYMQNYEIGGVNTIGRIASPNLKGEAATFEPKLIPLPACDIAPSWGFSNFIESYFKTSYTGVEECPAADLEIVRKADFEIEPMEECRKFLIRGTSDLAVTLIASYRSPIWTIQFGDGEFATGYNEPGDIVHEYKAPGDYVVNLQINGLCDDDAQAKPLTVRGILPSFTSEQDCENHLVKFINTTQIFPDGTSWSWEFGDGSAPTPGFNAEHFFSAERSYQVTLHGDSPDQCASKTEQSVKAYHPLQVELGDDILICEGDERTLTINKQADANYLWSHGGIGPETKLTSAGTYRLEVSRANCLASDELVVDVDDDCLACKMIVPNVFTPNETDHHNSHFTLDSDCDFQSFSLHIYDRYGNHIFQTQNFAGWNGTANETPVPSGIYYFTFGFTREKLNGELLHEIKKGWVSLVR